MPNTLSEEELRTLLRIAETAKFRICLQGDIAVLAYIKRLNGQASASQLVLALTLARGKMVSLTQIAPILKCLQDWNCITRSKSKAKRKLTIYAITQTGETVLKSAIQLLKAMSAKPKGRSNK